MSTLAKQEKNETLALRTNWLYKGRDPRPPRGVRVMPLMMVGLLTASGVLRAEPPAGPRGGPPPASTNTSLAGKKLIRVGSELVSRLLDAPSISQADLPTKVEIWQQTGLDGLVFSIAAHGAAAGPINMSGQWWNPRPRAYTEFIPEIKAFRSVRDWGRLTDNFLWSSLAIWGNEPPYICQDWFNDEQWKIILSNVRIQARVAKACGFKGILLDTEQYDHHGRGPWHFPFNYRHYAETGFRLAGENQPRSMASASTKVFDRGRQYAAAVCEAYPGLTLMVIPTLYRPKGFTDEEILFPAFLDGVLAGLDESASCVAGTEDTYLDSVYGEMATIRDGTMTCLLDHSRDPQRMQKKLSLAVGIWTDGGDGTPEDRYSDTNAGANQRDPERHKHAVHNALVASGKYAWVYGEQSRFLTTVPTPLIREYWRANLDGHRPQDLNWLPVPKWDMTDYSGHDRRMAALDTGYWPTIEGRYDVVLSFPEYWHFFFDTEQRGRYISPRYDHEAWPLLSTLKCWQSQSIKANGEGIYRTMFDVSASLTRDGRRVYLAFGGFSPDRPNSWTVVRLNGKGFPISPLVDVTEAIKPGGNFLAVQVINKSGPGGPLGHIKLVRENRVESGSPRLGDK